MERHAETLDWADIEMYLETWEDGSVEELRALLIEYHELVDIEGALLIGDLPVAWYEQEAFDQPEEFPMDLFLQDLNATWSDTDGNGRYDAHTDLNLEIYTSRLIGDVDELRDYFDRVHLYRTSGALVDVSTYIFIDNNWSKANTEEAFHLDKLYSSVEIVKERVESDCDVYLERMTGQGAEFVFQWMHSAPQFLQFEDFDSTGELVRPKVLYTEIGTKNFKGSFYNLYNCSAARFTEPNLAREYTLGTDYGLAIIGSTKTGAVANPDVFHKSLVLGRRWGEAFQLWYNQSGKHNDEWHLGVVLMGDPLLRLTGDLYPWGGAGDASNWTPPGEVEDIDDIMRAIAEGAELGSYEEYREAYPQFFE